MDVDHADPGVAVRGGRQAWMDNLRVVVIAGVVGAHIALIYALDVGWYYEERTAGSVTTAVLAGLFAPGMLFGMGVLFFVAGLATSPSLARKGTRRFVRERMWRLGVPTVAYVFLVNPAMEIAGERAMAGRIDVGAYLRRSYWEDVALGVAWFLAALLVFSLAYAAWRARHPAAAPGDRPQRRTLVRAGIGMAVASFVVRLAWPFLETDAALGLNLWEYPQMATLFGLGALAGEQRWFAVGLPSDLRRWCGGAALVGCALAAVLGAAIATSDAPEPYLGGFALEATVIPVVEAAIAIGGSLWAVAWFRRRWDDAGAVVHALGRASFAAYLVHAPVTVLLAASLRSVEVATEVKLVVVFGLSLVVSFGAGWLLTRSRVVAGLL